MPAAEAFVPAPALGARRLAFRLDTTCSPLQRRARVPARARPHPTRATLDDAAQASSNIPASAGGAGAAAAYTASGAFASTTGGTSDGAGAGEGGSGGGRRDLPEKDDSGSDLPQDVREALSLGLIGAEAIARYRRFASVPVLGLLVHIGSFRTRFLADSAFFFKLLVQELVGNGTALASELAVRGKQSMDELEYIASDLIVGTVVEAAFVWLLAPTLALPRPQSGPLQSFFAALPANAFEASTAARSYTLAQRAAAFVCTGVQYFGIGVVAGIVGTAITYGLIEARKAVDKEYAPKRPLPDVLPNAVAWGAFMALSSNTRFQIVEGMERGIAAMFGGTQNSAVNASIVTLRFANNYWGGVQFVQFFRWLGLHATEDHIEAAAH